MNINKNDIKREIKDEISIKKLAKDLKLSVISGAVTSTGLSFRPKLPGPD